MNQTQPETPGTPMTEPRFCPEGHEIYLDDMTTDELLIHEMQDQSAADRRTILTMSDALVDLGLHTIGRHEAPGEWDDDSAHIACTLPSCLADATTALRRLRAALRAIEAFHQPDPEGDGQGYGADGYGNLGPCCQSCGRSDEYGVPSPCHTLRLARTALEKP